MPADPYRYFRTEARELLEVLEQGIMSLEKRGAEPVLARDLLRHAHTLKGAARVVRLEDVAALAHRMEDRLAALREAGVGPDRSETRALLELVDRIRREVEARTGSGPVADRAPGARSLESVRVDVDRLEALSRHLMAAEGRTRGIQRHLGTLGSISDRLSSVMDGLDGAAKHDAPRDYDALLGVAGEAREEATQLGRSLSMQLDSLRGELREARAILEEARRMSAGTLFPDLERAVHDAAEALQRAVRFRGSGGEVRLDAHVLSRIREALLHVVRNAVTHGIEAEAVRLQRDKPSEGTVQVSVSRRNHRVVFTCSDDGRGIDPAVIRRALVERGGMDADEVARIDDAALLARLVGSGVSTQGEVSMVAGRGVGLDVVDKIVRELKGDVHLTSEPARGTLLEISVPLSLSAMPILTVEAGSVPAALPLDAVRGTRWLGAADIRSAAAGEIIEDHGQTLPLVRLDTLLVSPASPGPSHAHKVVLVEHGGHAVAVAVTRIGEIRDAVVHPPPSAARVAPVVAGACLEPDRPPRLVLAPNVLVTLAATASRQRSDAEPPRAPILIVDDSLTTRMLEQSILESAGYEVDLATSGEEALEMACARRYGMFVVDVEMPGMDGFALLAAFRADPALREIPAVIVTSRGSEEDIRRGKEAGARAYITKGDFDQRTLLDVVARLVG